MPDPEPSSGMPSGIPLEHRSRRAKPGSKPWIEVVAVKTNPMSCGEAREKLPLYVGGDLDPDVLEAVRAHFQECSACAEQSFEAQRARRELVAAFRQPEALTLSPNLWPGIRATLRAEGRVRDAVAPVRLPAAPARARRPHWTWAFAPVAAAAALLLVAQLGGGGLERAPRTLPVADAPRTAPTTEVVLAPPASSPVSGDGTLAPDGPLPRGALKRVPPDKVQQLRAFQPRQGEVDPGGNASLASFGSDRVR